LSLPPDFKKKITKAIQDRTDTQQRKERSKIDYTALESVISGRTVKSGDGEFYLVPRELKDLYSDTKTLVQRYSQLFMPSFKSFPGHDKLDSEIRKLLNTTPERAIFLDTETSGFASNPVFLIGVLYYNNGNFLIDQLFARNYSEETAILEYFGEFAPGFDTVLTFNGKSFDIPFIRDRMIYHRKKFQWAHNHVDLLHHSRRKWKKDLPDCRLQTLESYICHRNRVEDLPSSLVPMVYQEFVRSGDARLLADIFHHNALDLITLVELTVLLLS